MTPVITLLTDFGTRDVYVGVMKGVIARRCPQAKVIDLTHDVAPGDVSAAAYLLSTAWRYFPAGTIHVAVVDPGVGGARAPLAAEAAGHRFVGPDNGLFATIFEEAGAVRGVRIENPGVRLEPLSRTFHGRDLFAPAAAALAGGASLESLGPPIYRWERLAMPEPWMTGEGVLVGQVVYVDRFGNLITNLRRGHLRRSSIVRVAGREVRGLSASYDGVAPGALLAIIGSSDRLEISVNRGSAAAVLDARTGTQVEVHSGEQQP